MCTSNKHALFYFISLATLIMVSQRWLGWRWLVTMYDVLDGSTDIADVHIHVIRAPDLVNLMRWLWST
ncbi:hypothetical protein PAXRUDRAFT_519758 [Paxillus rubicundulus Ve08.2h10]|uniref:Uncharacterized protein n=1 Tax=Paxillus rubicundulus Ve08.2h10 TaxID=930991 RepID=A0A0D0DND7_9AGAM|nr:hypothetical protein PAXRUDRAFT_519758 [Paxillus rubicundulus Ve08.2h10]